MNKHLAKELLHKYRLGQCTPAEEEAILKWVDTAGLTPHPGWTEEEKAIFFELLDKRISSLTGINISSRPEPAETSSVSAVIESTELTGGSQQSTHRIGRRWIRYAAAAAILLLISTAAIVFLNNNTKKDQTLAKSNKLLTNDVLPGRERATLTFANGKTIVLDSTKGSIVKQGDFSVINLNGKLGYQGKDKAVQYHTLSTPKGGQYKLQLPDGTDVWLNAASSISYPTAFMGKDRRVTVTGEVYFEVAKDKTKPFKVNIYNKSEVEVLGTHFNINSYSDEDGIKTTLLEGSVKMSQAGVLSSDHQSVGGRTSVTLRPGQQAQTSNTAAGIAVKSDADLEEVMAWKEGYFQFNEVGLSSVLKQLARWYDVDVLYEAGIPSKTFIGEIPRDATLSQVLKVLEKTGVHFRIENKRIIVMQEN